MAGGFALARSEYAGLGAADSGDLLRHPVAYDTFGRFRRATRGEGIRLDAGASLPEAHTELAWSAFLEGWPERFVSWMSHGDSIVRPGDGWKTIGVSETGVPAILVHTTNHGSVSSSTLK